MVVHSSNNIKDYFQHTTPTQIPGEPTYETLVQLQKEVRANGRSVPCRIGGDNQGRLGLVTSTATYARINPATIFDRPTTHPVPPTQIYGATQYQIQNTIRQYNEDVQEFNPCNLIERTVIQQINSAVNDEYLADLINPDTDILTRTFPTILHTLFASYGDITEQSLAQKNYTSKTSRTPTPSPSSSSSTTSTSMPPWQKLQAPQQQTCNKFTSA